MRSVDYAVWLIKGEASHENGGGVVEFHAITAGATIVPDPHQAWASARSNRDGPLYVVRSIELVVDGSLALP